MIEIIVEELDENPMVAGAAAAAVKKALEKKKKKEKNEDMMSTSSSIDMNPTGRPRKKKIKEARKYETFKVTDDCFNKFRNGKTKFERWSKYLDLGDESQKRIYDWARRNHKGVIVLQNATTGAVRGIRYNRSGGGQWGKLSRVNPVKVTTQDKIYPASWQVAKKPKFSSAFHFELP